MTLISENAETVVRTSNFAPEPQEQNDSSDDMRMLFESCLRQKGESDFSKLNWVDGKTVEFSDLTPWGVHQFVLALEALGKTMSIEKKTVITIK